MTFINHPPLYMGDTLPEEEDTNSSDTVSISALSDFGRDTKVIGEEDADDENDEDDEDDEDDDESPRAKRIR